MYESYLEDDSALEHDQHEPSEDRVVPVLIQAPQSHAEHLEDKERGYSMLSKELCKLGDRDLAKILSVILQGGRYGIVGGARGGGEPLGRLVSRQRGVGVDRVRKRGEELGGRVVRVGISRVREGVNRLGRSRGDFVDEGDDLSLSSMLLGDDLDKASGFEIGGLQGDNKTLVYSLNEN